MNYPVTIPIIPISIFLSLLFPPPFPSVLLLLAVLNIVYDPARFYTVVI